MVVMLKFICSTPSRLETSSEATAVTCDDPTSQKSDKQSFDVSQPSAQSDSTTTTVAESCDDAQTQDKPQAVPTRDAEVAGDDDDDDLSSNFTCVRPLHLFVVTIGALN